MKNKFWTREAPKKPGWYWAKMERMTSLLPIEIYRDRASALRAKHNTMHYPIEYFTHWSREPITFPPAPEEE